MRSCSLPDDFVSKIVCAEDFAHHQADKRIYTPIAMHIDASLLVHQIPHQDQPLVNHRNKRIRPASPGVAVGDLFQQVRFLVESLAADLDVHRKTRADIERRVYIDQLQAARVLDLAAQRAALQRGEDQLVVAPDEFVGPAFQLTPTRVKQITLYLRRFLARLVHMLQRLERQHGGTHIAGLAVPHQLHLALVLK